MLVEQLKKAIQLLVAHVPEDSLEARLALGTLDIIHLTLLEARITDIRTLRKSLKVKEPETSGQKRGQGEDPLELLQK